MSSLGDTTITFQVDRTAVDAFLNELKAGYVFPVMPQVPGMPAGGGAATFGGGASTGPAGPLVYPQSYQSPSTYYPMPRGTRQAKMPRSGGGGRGGKSANFGRITRMLSAGYAIFEAMHLAGEYANYTKQMGMAGSDQDALRAEQGLQKGAYGTPIIGGLLNIATAPQQFAADSIASQEAERSKWLDMLKQAIEASAAQAGRISGIDAGPAGSYGRESAAIKEEERKAKEQAHDADSKRADESDRMLREQESAANTMHTMMRGEAAQMWARAAFDLTPNGIMYNTSVALARGESVAQAAKDAAAQPAKDAAEAAKVSDAADPTRDKSINAARDQDQKRELQNRKFFDEDIAAAEKEAADRKAELDWTRNESLVKAREQRDVAIARRGPEFGQPGFYRPQPDVAEAMQTFDSGIDQARELQHKQNDAQARAVLEGTKARLQSQQYQLQFGGHAESLENPAAMDLGQPSVAGPATFHQNDDSLEALKTIADEIKTLDDSINKLGDKL